MRPIKDEEKIQVTQQPIKLLDFVAANTYDTTRDGILTFARKPTWVSLIYSMETTNKKYKTEKKLKSKDGYAQK